MVQGYTDMKDQVNHQSKHHYQINETGVFHKRFGPVIILDTFFWNKIPFYEIRDHGTSICIQVTESQLTKEEPHVH